MKISNKEELQQIAINHSSDIDFKDIMNLVQQNHILFYSVTLLLHQVILYIFDIICYKEHRK